MKVLAKIMEARQFDLHYQLEDEHWWFAARRKIVLDQLDLLIPKCSFAKILDAGCGTGRMLQDLKKYGSVFGMDISPQAVAYAQSRENEANQKAQISLGKLPSEIPFGNEKFDLITMLDVLEHLEEDERALHALRQRMTADGVLVITVPAFQSLWSGHDVVNHHQRRYRKKMLADLLKNSGFRIIKMTYFNALLFPIIAPLRILSRWAIGLKPRSDLKSHSKSMNYLLRMIMIPERLWLHKFSLPFGVSLLAIAEPGA